MTHMDFAPPSGGHESCDGDRTARSGSLLAEIRGGVKRLEARVDVLQVSLLVTALLLLLYSDRHWFVRIPVTLLVLSALLDQRLLQRPRFWLLTAAFAGAGVFVNWYSVDNHKYLMAYWCAAIFCAMTTADPERSLRRAARWLIGLCFAFAVGWKLATPDFLSGSFFEHCMLTDERFAGFSDLFAGVSLEQFDANRRALAGLHDWAAQTTEVSLVSNGRVQIIAQALAYWTVVIEALVAIAFLVPSRSKLGRWRDLLLVAFILSTYTVATVLGFGYLLIAMGLCQSSPQRPRVRLLYIGAAFALQIYVIPWHRLLGLVAGG